jgi:hypothetical protein
MPMIPPEFEQRLKQTLKAELKKLKPKPDGAPPEYDKAMDDFASAVAAAVSKEVIATVLQATILDSTSGPCTIT